MSTNWDPLSMEEVSGGAEEVVQREEEGEWNRESRVPVKVLGRHNDGVTAACLCHDDRQVLSCSSDCSAILWDVVSCQSLRTFDGVHGKTITDCTMIPSSNRMVTVSWDKKMASCDVETGQTLWRSQQLGLLTSCSASSDGRLVVCASDPQNGFSLIDAASGQTLCHVSDIHRSTVTRCRFDPQGHRVATVAADRSIRLWDARSQRTTVSIDSNHGNVISDCCFTNNGNFLCTASWDKTLKLWDMRGGGFRSHGGTALQQGHESSVSSCCFSVDATLLVSGSYDRTVALWDMTTLSPSLVLKGHNDWVTDVMVSADRKLVISTSKDRTIRLWDVSNMEDISQVMEKRRTEESGIHMLKCEQCGKPFPVLRLQMSELLTQCVFCRLNSPSRYHPQPPPIM